MIHAVDFPSNRGDKQAAERDAERALRSATSLVPIPLARRERHDVLTRLKSIALCVLLGLLQSACATAAPVNSNLSLEVFTAGERGYGVTSVIVYGPTEAVLVDAQFTHADAALLAQRIEALGRRLTAILVTHPDADHFIGLRPLHERFPDARIYMTAAAIDVYRDTIGELLEQVQRSNRPHEAPDEEPLASPLASMSLSIDGQSIEIVPDLQGDYGPRPVNSVIWIPSLRALLASDIAFDGVHLWLDDSTPAGRAAWRVDLTRLQAMGPAIVVAGHKRSADAMDSPAVLAETRRYLETFERQLEANEDAEAFTAAMQQEYPDHAYPIFLTIAARSAYSDQAHR